MLHCGRALVFAVRVKATPDLGCRGTRFQLPMRICIYANLPYTCRERSAVVEAAHLRHAGG